MNWEAEIAEAKARIAKAEKDLDQGHGDIELVKGCLAYLTQVLASRDNELARTAQAGRNAV